MAWCGILCLCLLPAASPAAGADDPPPPPAAFGIRLGDRTAAVHAHMREAGYRSRDMRLDDGCVMESFEHGAADAVMRRAAFWFCGPERRVARWEIEGQAGETFYTAVKERFGLGGAQRRGDAVGTGFGDYERRFAHDVRLILTNTHGMARLRLEDPAALHDGAAAQAEAVRHLEETAIGREQARQVEQQAFF